MSKRADHAFEVIREMILSDQVAPGDRITETELAELTGASRTPVREAIRRLASEGLVEFSPNRGARVAEWTARDLEEVFAMRALLEGYGAQLAAARITDEELAHLEQLADGMEANAQVGTPQALDVVAELNDEFHRRLLDAAGNELLRKLLQSIASAPLVAKTFRRYDADALTRSMRQHKELIAALREHDGGWATAVMRSHILSARQALWEFHNSRPYVALDSGYVD